MNRLPVAWKRRLTDRFILRKTNAVVALSRAERDFLTRRRDLRPERIAVIPNGICASVFDRISSPAALDHDLLLFVGQLQKFKGLDYLLNALPAVRAVHPGIKLSVVYQTGALLDDYRAQAARLGLNRCVEFAGSKPADALAVLYSKAAVVVSPSLGECLSTVVLEAMFCGAPVVATDVGGIREQLDEETGVIVPPRDSAALAQAICTLLADPQRRRQMGAAACQKARAKFSVSQMIDRHVRLYEQLLETHARAA
jgi:glycosyltransferase involved in cell wall biosynthesis